MGFTLNDGSDLVTVNNPAATANGLDSTKTPVVALGAWNGFSSIDPIRGVNGQGPDGMANLLPFAVALWNAASSSYTAQRTPTVYKTLKAQAITAATPVSIWTPTSGKKFRVMGWMLSLSVAGSILFEDTTGGANEFLRTPLLAAGIGQASPPMGNGYLSLAANNQLFLDVSASGSVSGFIFGTEE